MIVIASMTAQGASTSHSLEHPPVLTINTRYGAYICEGTKYTCITDSPKKTKFYGRPASCVDKNIPSIGGNDVVLIKSIDVDTIGALLRASGLGIVNEDFWEYVSKPNKDKNSKYWSLYNGILAWLIERNPLTEAEGFSYVEVSDFCFEAFNFIKEALLDGHLAHRMGNAYIYLQEKIDIDSFYREYPCGLICRKTKGEDVEGLFRDSRVMCVYDVKRRSISLSSKSHIEGFSCREVTSSFWGGDVTGDAISSSSPKYRAMGEGEFHKFIMTVIDYLSRV